MKIDVLTLFPEMFAPMTQSIMGIAREKNHFQLSLHNFRDHAINKHGHVDDYPYGGGAGMLLRVEPIVHQLEAIGAHKDACPIILVDPAGKTFNQDLAWYLAQADRLVFICGHYEGFDDRVRSYVSHELSIGNYVLTNGELPAMVMMDAIIRLRPEVVGNEASLVHESFQNNRLEYPQYTRPAEFRGMRVPDVLLSGHHEKIAQWQAREALRRTYIRRPDLLEAGLSPQETLWIKDWQENM